MANPTLLILAGGAASRFGRPKVIEPVGPHGETIVEYSIFDARRAGFSRIVFVIRKEIEQAFKEMTTARFGSHHVRVEHVCQELGKLTRSDQVPDDRTKPWGTTHAILMAANTIHEPFAVINVADYYGPESFRVLARHLSSASTDYAMVGFRLRNTLSQFGCVARAICDVDDHGYLCKIVEQKDVERDGSHARATDEAGCEMRLTGEEFVSMNMWGFHPSVFDLLRQQFQYFLEQNSQSLTAECLIPSTMNALLTTGKARVKVLPGSDSWFGITYTEDHAHAIEKVRQLIEGGYYPTRLWG